MGSQRVVHDQKNKNELILKTEISLHPPTPHLLPHPPKKKHLQILTRCVIEWVSEWVKSLSRVRLFVTPWTIACQAPPSMGFSRQEYWSKLPLPSSRDLLHPGIKYRSSAWQMDSLPLSYLGSLIGSYFLADTCCSPSLWKVDVISCLGSKMT